MCGSSPPRAPPRCGNWARAIRCRWLRVKDNETTLGWVHAPLTGKTPHMVVTARTANLRAGPGQNHRVVGRLDELEVVRTLGKQGSWAHVQRDSGQKGWVARSLTWGW
jgi:uncharacterized protein YgiM (DUF1202 family)